MRIGYEGSLRAENCLRRWPKGSCDGLVQKDALLYEPYPDGNVRCHLCAHHCLIPEGKRGVCQVRQNVGGKLYTRGTLVAGVGMSVRNNRRQLE